MRRSSHALYPRVLLLRVRAGRRQQVHPTCRIASEARGRIRAQSHRHVHPCCVRVLDLHEGEFLRHWGFSRQLPSKWSPRRSPFVPVSHGRGPLVPVCVICPLLPRALLPHSGRKGTLCARSLLCIALASPRHTQIVQSEAQWRPGFEGIHELVTLVRNSDRSVCCRISLPKWLRILLVAFFHASHSESCMRSNAKRMENNMENNMRIGGKWQNSGENEKN